MDKMLSVIESILFAAGESVTARKLSEILELNLAETRKLVLTLQKKCEEENRGIQIIELNQAFQMTTARENSVYIDKLCKQTRSKGLSPATIEVLAIVAYKQPVTKGEIETIRGVSCDKAMKTLLERELIEVRERQGNRGNLYVTGEGFLRIFGLRSLRDLPVMDAFHQLSISEVEKGE